MASVTVRWLDEGGAVRTGGLEDVTTAVPGRWCWVDVASPDVPTVESLADRFSLHPLAVEDSLHTQRRPKLDIDSTGLFLAWLTPERMDDETVTTREFDAFLGTGYLITLRANHDPGVAEVFEGAATELRRGPDWVLHAIIDRHVDSVLPLVDELGDELEQIEDEMLGEPRQTSLARLHTVRRQLVFLHRVVAPERDIIRQLARERSVVSEEAYRYFQDVGDHLARVEESIATYRDVAAAIMEIYLSSQSNRMNEIMKQLTVVATIFMPLTLISGIYGMNVLQGMWPPWDAAWSFAAVCTAMIGIAVAMGLYFRRKKWW